MKRRSDSRDCAAAPAMVLQPGSLAPGPAQSQVKLIEGNATREVDGSRIERRTAKTVAADRKGTARREIRIPRFEGYGLRGFEMSTLSRDTA